MNRFQILTEKIRINDINSVRGWNLPEVLFAGGSGRGCVMSPLAGGQETTGKGRAGTALALRHRPARGRQSPLRQAITSLEPGTSEYQTQSSLSSSSLDQPQPACRPGRASGPVRVSLIPGVLELTCRNRFWLVCRWRSPSDKLGPGLVSRITIIG